MIAGRGLAAAGALAGALAAAGCGLGPGPSSKGTASLLVTRDYGTQELASATESDPAESETVLRFLDRNTDITTRYGGGFVQSIDGLAGTSGGDRVNDWFFYRNGIESPVGSADVRVRGGDRIWWDYRDWTDAMRVPAVVGSFPQPFAEAAASGPTPVDCVAPRSACDEVASELRDAGVATRVVDGLRRAPVPRVLVGPWSALRADAAAAQLQAGPATSGVFATFDGAHRLALLDVGAHPDRTLGPRAGLVAALRSGEDPPTWLVTGGSARGVAAAAKLLNAASLANRYAVAADGATAVGLPLAAASGGSG